MKERAFIALDGMTAYQALSLADRLHGLVYGFKVNDLLDGDRSSQELVHRLKEHGKVFVDVKGHDIPATIANRVQRHVWNGADIITVHASGGRVMIKAAVDAYINNLGQGMGILAVTVLTSLTEADCRAIYGGTLSEVVRRFVHFTDEARAFGFVCSPQELVALQGVSPHLKRIVPGTRSLGAHTHDQARVDTPANAVKNGADLLVIGRQVTTAPDPVAAIQALDEELASAD